MIRCQRLGFPMHKTNDTFTDASEFNSKLEKFLTSENISKERFLELKNNFQFKSNSECLEWLKK